MAPGKMAGKITIYDSLFAFGNSAARCEAAAYEQKAKHKLRDTVPSTTVFEVFYTTRADGRVVVTTAIESAPRTWVFCESESDWKEIDPIIRSKPCLATGLIEQRDKLQAENLELKCELATTKLELSLLRHELQRAKDQIPVKRSCFTFTQKFLLGLMLGLILATNLPSAAAESPDAELKRYLKGYADGIYNWFSEKLHALDSMDWLQLAVMLWSHWVVHLAVFVIVGLFRYDNVTPTLVLAVLAIWADWRANGLLPIGAADAGSLVAHCVGMFMYPLNMRLAFVLLLCIIVGNVCYSVIVGDNPAPVLTGSITVVTVFILNLACDILGCPKNVPSIIYIIYKVVLISVVRPSTVVVKDADGKVVETTNVHPLKSAFVKLSSFKQMFQKRKSPRVSVDPFFPIAPNCTVMVKTPEGTGTGFRVQNYLITAKHVVGDNETLEVVHEGRVYATKIKWVHPTKDLAFLMLPAGLQELKAFKIAKEVDDGPVAIITKAGDHVAFAVSPGVVVGDEMTYAVQTPDGSSGAPVVFPTGRAVAVHTVNTGFSAGAVILRPSDLPPVEAKSDEIQKLKAEIEKLKAMQQCSGAGDVVGLIREAIQREMLILRKELSDFEQKKKGRNKVNRRQGKRKPVWTEEEYKAMMEKGFTKQQLQEMAENIRERMENEIDDAYNDVSAPLDDMDDDEVNRVWFKQRLTKDSPQSRFNQYWCEEWNPPSPRIPANAVVTKFNLLADEEVIAKMSRTARRLIQQLQEMIDFAVIEGREWNPEVDKDLFLEEASEMYYKINEECFVNDLPCFLQSKNGKKGPAKKQAPKKSTN
uniref:ORF1a protein n=1 Tax=Mops bat astrovirus TaxID=3141890 RepID=A0AAU7E2K9_9VIRU